VIGVETWNDSWNPYADVEIWNPCVGVGTWNLCVGVGTWNPCAGVKTGVGTVTISLGIDIATGKEISHFDEVLVSAVVHSAIRSAGQTWNDSSSNPLRIEEKLLCATREETDFFENPSRFEGICSGVGGETILIGSSRCLCLAQRLLPLGLKLGCEHNAVATTVASRSQARRRFGAPHAAVYQVPGFWEPLRKKESFKTGVLLRTRQDLESQRSRKRYWKTGDQRPRRSVTG
jgi:hypothetical protein